MAWNGWGGSYHRRLAEIYRFLVSPGQAVLEIGCGTGLLLGHLAPDCVEYWGTDYSQQVIRRTQRLCRALPSLSHVQLSHRRKLPLTLGDELWNSVDHFAFRGKVAGPTGEAEVVSDRQ